MAVQPGVVAYPVAGQAPQTVSLIGPSGQPVLGQQIVMVSGDGETPITSYKKLFVFGIIQLILGILLVAFNIFATIVFAMISAFVGMGYFTGIFAIIAGAFGIAAGRRLTKCKVVTHLVMSIISAVFCFGVMLTSIFGIIFDAGNWLTGGCGYGCTGIFSEPAGGAANILLLMIGFLELIAAIVSAALTCRALCLPWKCSDRIYYTTQPPQYPTLMPVANAEGAYAPPAHNPDYMTKS